jgi:hypothetical protein
MFNILKSEYLKPKYWTVISRVLATIADDVVKIEAENKERQKDSVELASPGCRRKIGRVPIEISSGVYQSNITIEIDILIRNIIMINASNSNFNLAKQQMLHGIEKFVGKCYGQQVPWLWIRAIYSRTWKA